MMRVTTVFVLALSIYGTAAIPSDADAVVPEDTLFQSQAHQFEEAKHMMLEMKSQGNSDKDCRKLADNTEDIVKDNIKAEQDTLNKMAKGKECPSRGQKAVDRAADNVKKAQEKATGTAKKYAKALDYRVDFGKHRFGDLTEGKCGVFFRSSAYTNAKAAAKAAKDAKLKAAGALDQAKKAQQTAIEDQKKAIRKCYCDLKKLHAKTLNDMNVKVEKANQKGWTRAGHIRCVLDGTPMAKCQMPAMPKVKKVSLTKAAEAAVCTAGPEYGKSISVSLGRTAKCGGQTSGTPVGLASNPGNKRYQCTASYCDPFKSFKTACVNKFGKGAHQCTKTELDNASAAERKVLGGMYASTYPLLTSCGTWNKNWYSSTYGGWKFLCRTVNVKTGVWKKAWNWVGCNSQSIPCCKI